MTCYSVQFHLSNKTDVVYVLDFGAFLEDTGCGTLLALAGSTSH